MQINFLFRSVLTGFLLCVASIPLLAAQPQQTLLKKRVLADLDCIHNIFEVKYAPIPWKKKFADWDLTSSIQEAKNRVQSSPNLTIKEAQMILRDFFNSTRDFHVGVRFYSTENASLPFLVKGSQGRYFVSYIDRDELSLREFPFEVGDEILTFGGRPIHEVIQEIREKEYGPNTFETNQALAEMSLTQRRGEMGQFVPSGRVEIAGIKKGLGKEKRVVLHWVYTPEKIKDFSKLNTDVGLRSSVYERRDLQSILNSSQFFEKFMVSHLWDKASMNTYIDANNHALGARTSFIPSLGTKTWKSGADTIFDAYIFETPSGKKIGYIRVPHYAADEEEAEAFGTVMNFFQKRTDALIIDQVNNPGGSVFYLYTLVATLTDKPLYTPKHHIALSQEEVYVAYTLLPYLEKITDDYTAQTVLGDNIGGYPVDYKFAKLMIQFCHFMIDQWERGKLFSDPTFLFGVDEIRPHPKYRYNKPVLVLINSLDFSGGDFFPAILQDNKRATLLGTRTAGAGGYVVHTTYPNHSGMKGFNLTGSLAERIDFKPIENLGVTPDIQYEITPVDLQENYREYIDKILQTVESLADKK